MAQHALVTTQQFNDDQLAIIRNTVAKGTNNEEFLFFMEVCKYHQLSPFARQIYAVVRNGKNGRQLTIQTSIDGYRLLAERSGKYAGQTGPEWCGDDGVWRDVWLSNTPPAAARIGILRKDFSQPIVAVAKYKSYVQPSPLWDKMPDVMLAKCAESLALRKAFPAEMSGIYTKEEMDQADGDMPTVAPLHPTTITVESTTVEQDASISHSETNLSEQATRRKITNVNQAVPSVAQDASEEGQSEALPPSVIDPLKNKYAVSCGIDEDKLEEFWPQYLQFLLHISQADLRQHHIPTIERDLDRRAALRANKKKVS